MSRHGCEARQYSDQMNCQRCSLYWDMNDDDPPDCLTSEQIERAKTGRAPPVPEAPPAADIPASLETLDDAQRAYAEAVAFITSRGLASEFYAATSRSPPGRN